MSQGNDVTKVDVPWGVHLAAAWAWRLLLLGLAGYVLYRILSFFSIISVPIAIAALITALLIGPVDWITRLGIPRLASSLIVLTATLAGVSGLLWLVGREIATQFSDIQVAVLDSIEQLNDWARNGPLGLSDSQITEWLAIAQDALLEGDTNMVQRATEVGVGIGYFFTGLAIALFAAIFFLYEGNRIWWWATLLSPAAARERVRSSGVAAWTALTSFVRATVIVALVDAIGIALVAWILGVPMALAIGVLVFLGAFVPIVGAFFSGMVAVVVALVDQGFWTAILMLLGVIAVQQIESNLLQPFLMGRFVSVHPLAIVLAIAAGVYLSGVVGALFAVPLVACVNAVIKHVAGEEGGPPPLDENPDRGDPIFDREAWTDREALLAAERARWRARREAFIRRQREKADRSGAVDELAVLDDLERLERADDVENLEPTESQEPEADPEPAAGASDTSDEPSTPGEKADEQIEDALDDAFGDSDDDPDEPRRSRE